MVLWILPAIRAMDWLPRAPLAAASLHMREEFPLPGGFLAIVNVILLAVCRNIGLPRRTPLGIAPSHAVTLRA
jgi:hypothetical protein